MNFIESDNQTDYLQEIENNQDILDMKNEIIEGVKIVMNEANEFASGVDAYSYLWLDDSQSYLAQFLTYGRQLTMEEMEYVANNDPAQPKISNPKIEDFREQVCLHAQLIFVFYK